MARMQGSVDSGAEGTVATIREKQLGNGKQG